MTIPKHWQEALDRLCERVYAVRDAVGPMWPYHADPIHGTWQVTEDGDWCGGHWVECLRVVGELANDGRLLNEARARTERLRPYLERDDQFRGHRFFYSAARQYATTGDRAMRTLALAAAYAVRSMAMAVNGGMPIGTQVQVKSTTLASRSIVAVDNVHPNLILDWWGLAETGDDTFAEGARRHLDLTVRDFIRDDGSTDEFIEYAPADGRVLRRFTLLGAHDASCWSRGQAWAIAGFVRAWEALGERRDLETARLLFDYWWERTGEDRVPPYDFMDPALETDPAAVPIDTSAAAIVVETLARIAVNRADAPEVRPFIERLPPMIDGLIAHLTPIDARDRRPAGMLIDGCFNQPKRFAANAELVWGSAYLLFALYYLRTGRVPC